MDTLAPPSAPWIIRPTEFGFVNIEDEDGSFIAQVGDGTHDGSGQAHLFVGAPSLLSACIDAIEYLEHGGSDYDQTELLDELRAAVARAA